MVTLIQAQEMFTLEDVDLLITQEYACKYGIEIYVDKSFKKSLNTRDKFRKTRFLLNVFREIIQRPIILECVPFEEDNFREYREKIFLKVGFELEGDTYRYKNVIPIIPDEDPFSQILYEWGWENCVRNIYQNNNEYLYVYQNIDYYYSFLQKENSWYRCSIHKSWSKKQMRQKSRLNRV